MNTISKPAEGENAPYFNRYIDLVPDDGRVMQHLQDNMEAVKSLVKSLPEAKHSTPHAPGEWTVQEILGHVIDTERIFAYRALWIARNDKTPLPGFEQDTFVPYSRANERSIDEILEEYSAVRAASIALFNSLDEAALDRKGTASNNPLTPRAVVYILVGHELHHLKSIQENYG